MTILKWCLDSSLVRSWQCSLKFMGSIDTNSSLHTKLKTTKNIVFSGKLYRAILVLFYGRGFNPLLRKTILMIFLNWKRTSGKSFHDRNMRLHFFGSNNLDMSQSKVFCSNIAFTFQNQQQHINDQMFHEYN